MLQRIELTEAEIYDPEFIERSVNELIDFLCPSKNLELKSHRIITNKKNFQSNAPKKKKK